MDDLAKKKKIRGGHRGYLTKILAQASDLVTDFNEENRADVVQLRDNIRETLAIVKKLDDEIVDLLAGNEESTEADVSKEIEDTGKVQSDAKKTIRRMETVVGEVSPSLPSTSNGESSSVGFVENVSPVATNVTKPVRAKLPKLEVKRFKGNVCKWQEFWDSFESAIHLNDCLSDVDKFNYLRGLVDEPAKSCIAGFSLTSGNYQAAVNILKERYGKKSAIQRAHMQGLLKTERVRDERDIASLRRMCDGVETHYRGLEALGIEQATYSAIVVPAILDQLPESVRLTITRGTDFHEWNMEDLLTPLKHEVELREEHHEPERKSGREQDRKNWKRNPTSAYALFAKSSHGAEVCAFCLGDHRHEDCKRVENTDKRKEILKKYSRCFNCLKKGHLARNCSLKVKCSACKKEHHTALCSSGKVQESKPKGPEADGEVRESRTTLVVSPKNVIGKVALQTAQAMLVGRKSGRVRVLFDSGSQRSFVTVKMARELGCTVLRREVLRVGTFGQRALNSEMREVVRLDLKSLYSSKVVSVEAYVVPEISFIRNQHLEVVRENYAHLKGLWLSDVCMSSDELEVDVLVGADYLWLFQKDRILRGDPGEPVAIDTVLGWVVSGPVGDGKLDEVESARVNFVTGEAGSSGMAAVNRFWDLESIGIKADSTDVHETVINDLNFNGQRYSVGLPWRESHDPLPTNYDLSLKRMKGQIKRLSKDPELLGEYDSIIKAQQEAGIIERVSSSNCVSSASKVHYIPHQAVVRKDAKTTKVRIVYDASAKTQKSGVSLNDCLHAGPSLNPLSFDILLRFRAR
jgi:hypothetical protein